MATLIPFRALRPRPADAAAIAAVPYDVVSTEEARAIAEGNPLSFLRVSRAEIELAPGTNPYSDAVYARALENYRRLTDAACFSLDEYDTGVIKKHERTRRDKEDDRTRHMLTLGAQTGPVFLTYRASADVNDLARRIVAASAPLFDFTATDGVRHTVWRAEPADRDALVSTFSRIPALYIADGHHRAASAARARTEIAQHRAPAHPLADAADYRTVMAVAFPHDHVQILPYNRVVTDLGALSTSQFLDAVGQRFIVAPGSPEPASRGEFAMYLDGHWHALTPRTPPRADDAIGALDVSVLQDQLLAPVLNIVDIRTDERIDFVGGIRGTRALEQLVDSGRFAVAFSLYPVSIADLMAVADANAIMPPKSTWFEPKLRDGLLVHVI
jgi:uncharacterized protein (DUF1015 family)